MSFLVNNGKFVLAGGKLVLSSGEKPKEKLATPTISLTNNTLNISGTSGATSHIYLNDVEKYTTTSTSYDLSTISGVSAGTYSVKIYQSMTGYNDSDYSTAVSWIYAPKLAKPEISLSGDTLTISGTTGATSYIYVASELKATTTNTTYDLSSFGVAAGTYAVTIIQKLTGYTDSDVSNAVTWTYAPKLATPVASVSGTIVSWGAVANAEKYIVWVDNISRSETTSASTLSEDISKTNYWKDLETGNHTVQISATATNYTESDLSIPVVVVKGGTMPVKGDLITMTLGNSTPSAGTQDLYRVLSISGSIAQVVAMYDQSTSVEFNDSRTNTYSGGDLDTYLNTTFYGSLNDTAKAAIQATSLTQYKYTYNSSVYNATTHASYADYSTKATAATIGNRYVYALDVEDIEKYFSNTFSTADIWTLFWNTTSQPSNYTYPWLRSALADDSISAWNAYGRNGYVGLNRVAYTSAARPALTIDLSKISWSKSE